MKVFGKIMLIVGAALLIALAAFVLFALIATANVKLDPERLHTESAQVQLLASDGEKIASPKQYVGLETLPSHLPAAFVAVEDKRFYAHGGLDVLRIGKAALKNIASFSFREGASTISQQLIKNTHLSGEKTIRRKLKEWKLTFELEKSYSKEQILELYLNSIYFGHSAFGVGSAAQYYFGKDAGELLPAESAMLAALVRSPNRYSPFINAEKCRNVRNSILARMQALGYLSSEDAAAAQNAPLPSAAAGEGSGNTYLSAVRDELQNIPLASPYSLLHGCKIYTYMNASLQSYVEELKTDADRSGKSILICDNRSGGAAAWFTTEGTFRRQPGSLLKPLAVYAPAIEENLLSACTPIADEKTNFDGYAPSNYKDVYHGYVTCRQALAQSLNVPAVKTLSRLGIDKSEKYLSRMGLRLSGKDKNLSLALGGVSEGYTLTQLTGAFSVFANEGYFSPPAFIRKIEDSEGNIVYERKLLSVKVFSEDTVYIVNDILKSAAKEGTAKKLAALPFDVCAKTGTCGSEKGNTDAYAVSYTKDYTVNIWMGNADNKLTDITGGGLPCHYAMLIDKKIYKDKRPTPFHDSENIEEAVLDKISFDKYHSVVRADENQPKKNTFTDIFRKSNLPKETSKFFKAPEAKASVAYKNNRVFIKLSQTEYYDIMVKRTLNGKSKVIYEGKCEQVLTDDNILPNEKYEYTVIPYYTTDGGEKIFGKELRLPVVYTKSAKKNATISDHFDWWEN